tara:strand:+ start:7949 stop:9457 length:1509 start_codon:yes stop_codon:yes gene_type:complete
MTIDYPHNADLVPYADIDQDGRSREEFGNLQELADSIQDLGLIHPPTLSSDNILIAGGRRLAALHLLGIDPVPVNYREKLPRHKIAEMELEENIKRLGMKWQEKVILLCRMHEMKTIDGIKRGKSWKQSETGALLGVSNGHVCHALRVGGLMLEGDQEIIECASLVEALNVLLARSERLAIKEIAIRSGASVVEPSEKQVDSIVVDFEDSSNPVIVENSREVLGATNVTTAVQAPRPAQEFELDLGKMLLHGDCLHIMKTLPRDVVDHIVTDIPYGIDMGNLSKIKDVDSVKDTHDVEQNVSMMPKFLKTAFHVIKPGGFCVFWYDLNHHEKLLAWAREIGWGAQSWPLVWCKTHTCINQSASKNYTKSTEVAMVLRKDSECHLQKASGKNYIIADGLAEKKLYSNPFAKPFEIWKFIIESISYKGQTILDPFAGQMSCPRACINLGRTPLAIELDPYHFYHGVQGVKELYAEMLQGNVKFTSDPIASIDPETIVEPAKTNE